MIGPEVGKPSVKSIMMLAASLLGLKVSVKFRKCGRFKSLKTLIFHYQILTIVIRVFHENSK